jgi:hypothetical protein
MLNIRGMSTAGILLNGVNRFGQGPMPEFSGGALCAPAAEAN